MDNWCRRISNRSDDVVQVNARRKLLPFSTTSRGDSQNIDDGRRHVVVPWRAEGALHSRKQDVQVLMVLHRVPSLVSRRRFKFPRSTLDTSENMTPAKEKKWKTAYKYRKGSGCKKCGFCWYFSNGMCKNLAINDQVSQDYVCNLFMKRLMSPPATGKRGKTVCKT